MPLTFSSTVITNNRGRWTLDIQRPIYTEDAYGQKTLTWQSVGTRRAIITPLSGREYFEANQTRSSVTHKISLRWIPWLRPNMRFVREAFTNAVSHAIIGVNTGAAGTASFIVQGNRLADLGVGSSAEVTGSTGNDGIYTIRAGSAYDSNTDETTINVEEAIPDATADGNIEFGGEHDEAIFNIVAIPGKSRSTDRNMTVLVKEEADYPD